MVWAIIDLLQPTSGGWLRWNTFERSGRYLMNHSCSIVSSRCDIDTCSLFFRRYYHLSYLVWGCNNWLIWKPRECQFSALPNEGLGILETSNTKSFQNLMGDFLITYVGAAAAYLTTFSVEELSICPVRMFLQKFNSTKDNLQHRFEYHAWPLSEMNRFIFCVGNELSRCSVCACGWIWIEAVADFEQHNPLTPNFSMLRFYD